MQLSLPFDDGPTALLVKIRARLLSAFGPQHDFWRLDPVSQLVNAMLGQNTRDEISLAAFERLLRYCPSWDDLLYTSPEEVEGIIRPVEHADVKAFRLPQALGRIVRENGLLDLHFLASWEEEKGLHWLKQLHGIGPKSAAAVLNFSTLRKRTLVVDRHLLRVGIRLALISPKATFQTGYDSFMRLVPDDWNADELYEMHWIMKGLSQQICTHTAPACRICPLRDLCPRVGQSLH